MTAPAILLVEDDPELRTLTSRALTDEGYAVRTCSTAAEMWIALRAAPADLVLLDIMLPGTSGIELCRRLRAESKVPIIFVSAKGSEADKVIGLELGADDYIPKPFSTRELVARIRAVMRRGGSERAQADRGQGIAKFAGWTVSFPRREVKSPSGAIVDLTGAEFDNAKGWSRTSSSTE
jgi:two-component system, OmpR family, response regulator